ncbi:hypothetical protein Anas_11442 [Armadillidium nasatum]|uniref:Uncharacterized protein n=1 Tax=Armadillidium nasatum TaxID=96803 RepID=A0A5N5SMR2_9CRUS|nr:hypothetical protein Anas_11442 [Armadillidium nasatum]
MFKMVRKKIFMICFLAFLCLVTGEEGTRNILKRFIEIAEILICPLIDETIDPMWTCYLMRFVRRKNLNFSFIDCFKSHLLNVQYELKRNSLNIDIKKHD